MEETDRTLAYIERLTLHETPLLQEMEKYAVEQRIPILDKHAAAVLEWAVLLKADSSALEVGTAIGYSSIRIATVIKDGAKLITLEKSSESYTTAQKYIARSSVADKITVVFGEAAETLKRFLPDSFGFIFLDADKKDYCPLLEPLIALLQPGGIMLVDNLLWHGNTVKQDEEIQPSWLSSTRFVREFNELFFNHPRLRAVLLPVGDGLGLAIKK